MICLLCVQTVSSVDIEVSSWSSLGMVLSPSWAGRVVERLRPQLWGQALHCLSLAVWPWARCSASLVLRTLQ